MKELKINIPEGYEIDKENSTFEKIVFKKKQNYVTIRPRSWEEYCENTKRVGFYIDGDSDIMECEQSCYLLLDCDKNFLPTRELAEVFLAMMQLMSLRQAWIGDWKPDWKCENYKYVIICRNEEIIVDEYVATCHSLSFPTEKMAEEFLQCFKDLLETAKPLL